MLHLAIFHESELVRKSFEFFLPHYFDQINVTSIDQKDEIDSSLLCGVRIFVTSTRKLLDKRNELLFSDLVEKKVKLMVLGRYKDAGTVNYFLTRGASCYLHENEPVDLISRAIGIIRDDGIYSPYTFSTHSGSKYSRLPEFTSRELDIFRLLRREMTNKEVAQICGIHVKTVEYHRKNIIEKCGSKNLLGALDYLIAMGIVPVVDT